MRHVHIFLLGLLLVLSNSSWAEAQSTLRSEELDLMRSVEDARMQTQPFRILGQLTRTAPEGEDHQKLEIDYDSGKYRFRVTSGSMPVTVFDGGQLFSFDGRNSAIITSPDKAQSELAFDPRILGINVGFRPNYALSDSLAFRSGLELSLVGNETISSSPVRVLTVTDRFKQKATFWVEASNPFRVHRYSLVITDAQGQVFRKVITESEFWPGKPADWIPRKTTTVSFEGDQKVESVTLELEKPIRPVRHPTSTWTVEGLRLPVGQPLADLRIKMRVGYWDGEKLVEDPP